MALIRVNKVAAIATVLLPNVDDYIDFAGLTSTPACTSGNSANHEMHMVDSVQIYNCTGYTTATSTNTWSTQLYGIKDDGTVEAITNTGLTANVSAYNYVIGHTSGGRTLTFS